MPESREGEGCYFEYDLEGMRMEREREEGYGTSMAKMTFAIAEMAVARGRRVELDSSSIFHGTTRVREFIHTRNPKTLEN